MSISSTDAALARSLSPHAPAELQAFIAKLVEMPAYVDKARLDLWETELNAMAVKGGTPAHAAATAIAAAGRGAPDTDFDLSDW